MSVGEALCGPADCKPPTGAAAVRRGEERGGRLKTVVKRMVDDGPVDEENVVDRQCRAASILEQGHDEREMNGQARDQPRSGADRPAVCRQRSGC